MRVEFVSLERVTVQQAQRLMESGSGALILDVRRHPDLTRIKGACYQHPDADWPREVAWPSPGRPILVYDDAPDESDAERVAARLVAQGLGPVAILAGGYRSWRRRRVGYPVESRRAPANPAGLTLA